MTTYMPPLCRKKRVADRYNPDSFRVISTDAEDTHPKFEPQPFQATFEPQTPQESLFPNIDCGRTHVLPRPTADYRKNRPQPKVCSFLTADVRLLNAPVCSVSTRETEPEQHLWWPARANTGKLEPGPHTLDTIYRSNYVHKPPAPQLSTRHSANPPKEPTRGIVPVNFMKQKDGQQRLFKEGISYEHVYDSRKDPNYPIRSKRQGAFVYSKMDPEASKVFVEYHTRLNQESQTSLNKETVPCNANTNHSALTSPPPQRRTSGNSTTNDQKKAGTIRMMETGFSPIEFAKSPDQGRQSLMQTASSPIDLFSLNEP